MKIAKALLTAALLVIGHSAMAVMNPAGTVEFTACANRVATQVKVGATDIVLATSLCRATIVDDAKDYYTVDSDVWELLPNKIHPPQVSLVGTIGSNGMIQWNANTAMIIGSVEDNGNEIRLKDGKRTVIGEDVRTVFRAQ